jgi:hypothetical protein
MELTLYLCVVCICQEKRRLFLYTLRDWLCITITADDDGRVATYDSLFFFIRNKE